MFLLFFVLPSRKSQRFPLLNEIDVIVSVTGVHFLTHFCRKQLRNCDNNPIPTQRIDDETGAAHALAAFIIIPPSHSDPRSKMTQNGHTWHFGKGVLFLLLVVSSLV